MKSMLIVALALVAFAAARPEEKYTDKYDNIDVQEILSNRRLFMPYVKCMLDQGKCSSEGKELKSHIKEALETYCEKCSDVQKTKTREVIAHLVNNEPEYWNQLIAKYDPSRKYVQKYEDELKKIAA